MQYVNRARHLVFLPLNTGESVHLSPKEVSRNLEAFETDRNPRLDRLVEIGAIEIIEESALAKKSSAKASKSEV